MMCKDVFVYHLDNELFKLFTLNKYDYKCLYNAFKNVTKIAFLICKDKILIPASNYFESDLSFNILNELRTLSEIGAIHLISSSQNIAALLNKKNLQHENNITLSNYHYSDFINNDNIVLPGIINKRKKSASIDIKSAWYSLASDETIKTQLFKMTDNLSATQFEDTLYEIPRRLGKKAYISNYILPLLPFKQEHIENADYFLNSFITKNYIASFLDEYNASCLSNIPIIDSNIILPNNEKNKYQFISYGEIVNLLFISQYKNKNAYRFINECNAYELIEFKNSTIWNSIFNRVLYKDILFNREIKKESCVNMNEYNDIKIGIITALPKEYAAMRKMMQETTECFFKGKGAGHRFCIGKINSANGQKHRIALALCGMGNNQAAIRVTNMLNHFKSIESIIMTGIAGGIPGFQPKDKQIRLGDIVVSEGIIQYDFTKEATSNIECRSKPPKPSAQIIEAVQIMKTYEYENNYPWHAYIDEVAANSVFSKPSLDTDLLYDSDNNLCEHLEDRKKMPYPKVYFGEIASANNLLKNPAKRNELKKQFNVLAIEMEASGIADATWNQSVGYLVVRGICDYCDTHKNDLWQEYAALVAAAYTRSIIELLPCFQ